jgi:hypothetical protein
MAIGAKLRIWLITGMILLMLLAGCAPAAPAQHFSQQPPPKTIKLIEFYSPM